MDSNEVPADRRVSSTSDNAGMPEEHNLVPAAQLPPVVVPPVSKHVEVWSESAAGGSPPHGTLESFHFPDDTISMESTVLSNTGCGQKRILQPVDSRPTKAAMRTAPVRLWMLTSRQIVEEYPQASLAAACQRYADEQNAVLNTHFSLVLIEDLQVGVEGCQLTLRLLGELVVNPPDAVLVRVPTPTIQSDSELTVLRHMEMMGMRLINPSCGIFDCINKFWTFQRLAGHGIPLPSTLSYGGPATDVKTTVTHLQASGAVQFPAVIKNVRGHRGKNVWLGETQNSTVADIASMTHAAPYLFQHYVKESHGKDVRVIVVGETVIGAMLREAPDDRLQSNCSQGGSGTPFDLPEDAKQMCVRIGKLLQMDIVGVDLLFSNSGGFVVCEVNPNVGYKAFDKAFGVSVGAMIAEYSFRMALANQVAAIAARQVAAPIYAAPAAVLATSLVHTPAPQRPLPVAAMPLAVAGLQ